MPTSPPRGNSAPAPAPSSVAVIGLGFVGLQVATAFGRVMPTLGYDIDAARVQELRKGHDRNREAAAEELASARLRFTDEPSELAACDAFIVAVPTPVDAAKRPELGALTSASRVVGDALRQRGSAPGMRAIPLVVFESSVYPGCTEEVCAPLLEEASGLRAGQGFHLAYSPERINPGDAAHRFETIVKVVSGQGPGALEAVAALYARVVPAGVYRAPDIATAEAAKVIENTQRDLNIALMNELSLVFHRMGLDTGEVLRAAETKWNFLPFRPGLVGGHCIPVDPYYLTHKAEELGYFPEVILAGRRINDGMGRHVAQQAVKLLGRSGRALRGARALVLGVAFKEDVPDPRNTRVVDVVRELEEFGVDVQVHDPLLGTEVLRRMGLRPVRDAVLAEPPREPYDLVVLAVPHRPYRDADVARFLDLLGPEPAGKVLVDVKGTLPKAAVRATGAQYFAL